MKVPLPRAPTADPPPDTVTSALQVQTSAALAGFVGKGALKQLFAQVVDARLAGIAALEKARAESATLRKLANSAVLFKDHPGLLQLRLVQAMSESQGHTFVLGNIADLQALSSRSGDGGD